MTTACVRRVLIVSAVIFATQTASAQPVSVQGQLSTWFTVNDADETAAKASELGGTVMVPPTDIPNVGRFSGIVSPQGVMFFVIKYLSRE